MAGPAGGVLALDSLETDGKRMETDAKRMLVRLFRNSLRCMALHPPHFAMAGDRDPLLLDWMQGWTISLDEENHSHAANASLTRSHQRNPDSQVREPRDTGA